MGTNWYYADGNRQVGPITEQEFESLAVSGRVRNDTLVWREGLANWVPLGTLRGSGAPVARGGVTPNRIAYAGFWIRFLARIIDAIVLYIVFLPLTFLVLGTSALSINPEDPEFSPEFLMMYYLLLVVQVAVAAVYEAWFLSRCGATPGKMIVGKKVIMADGRGLSFGRSIGRYFATVLSSLTLCIGFLMAAFDGQKRALHDHICDTRVIAK